MNLIHEFIFFEIPKVLGVLLRSQDFSDIIDQHPPSLFYRLLKFIAPPLRLCLYSNNVKQENV